MGGVALVAGVWTGAGGGGDPKREVALVRRRPSWEGLIVQEGRCWVGPQAGGSLSEGSWM